jgi:2,3-bisphosphoglycerate-independent phosphoglycerate mutase
MLNPIPAYVLRNSKGKYPFIPLVKIQATYNIRFAVIILVTIRKGLVRNTGGIFQLIFLFIIGVIADFEENLAHRNLRKLMEQNL